MKWLSLVTSLCFLIAASVPVNAEEQKISGKSLFKSIGCTNCHGKNGTNPTSRHVPILKGKSEDYLYKNAIKIFGGEEISGKSSFMHDQFCIGEEPEEGCYTPPTVDQLKVITKWLSESDLPKKKQTPQQLYVTASQAYEKLKALGDKALLIDVRSRAEVTLLGMPTIADANIPYMTLGDYEDWDEKKKSVKLVPNSGFILSVNQLLASHKKGKSTPIFLLCRSGSRSAKAAKLLKLVGYTNVYNITDGYEGDKAKEGANKGQRVVNGWKNSNLPWSYELDKSKLFWDT